LSDTPEFPRLDAVELPADAIEVARIGEAWGIKGWFKVIPFSAQPEALFSSKRWYLQPPERGAKPFNGTVLLPIKEAKDHSGSVVACAHEVADRTAAELLKGARVWVARSSFPTAATDEYYWVDLIGLSVVNREGVDLGVVSELLSTGPQTVLVIQYAGPEGKTSERMIPFVAAFIDEVELAKRQIRVDWQPDY
jgi:16S rRNA processing protein RimM